MYCFETIVFRQDIEVDSMPRAFHARRRQRFKAFGRGDRQRPEPGPFGRAQLIARA